MASTETTELPFRAEYAKSARASCKKCKQSIDKGEFRLAIMVQSPHFDGRVPNWFHFMCFFGRARVKSFADIENTHLLRWEDQERLKKKISEGPGAAASEASAKGKSSKKSKAKEKDGALSDFSIEYAKNARSGCKGCEQKIEKGEIRISKLDFESESAKRFGPHPRWYHANCFVSNRQELEYFHDAESLPGFQSMTPEDKVVLKKKIPKIEQKRKLEENPKNDNSSKKAKVEDSKEELELKKQNKQIFKYLDSLQNSGLKKSQLQDLLTYNDQDVPPGESRILERLADAMAFGALKRCPECPDGQLVYSLEGYRCIGNITAWTKCQYVTKSPQRVPFRVPPEFAEIEFLKNYKYVKQERLFPSNIPLPSTSQKSANGKPGAPSSGPLTNLKIASLGKLSLVQAEIKKKIEEMGGTYAARIDSSVACIISSEDQLDKASPRSLKRAQRHKVPIVSEKFLTEVKDGGVGLIITQNVLKSWDSNPQERIVALLETGSSKKKGKEYFTKNLPEKLKMKIKGGAAVDPDSGLEEVAHVYSKGDDVYSVVLGLVDIVRGTNSYYKLQLLEADHGNGFWVFRSWGRVGTTIGGNKAEEFPTRMEASLEFKRLYEEKTGNLWENRHNFVKYPNRFYPLEIDYGQEEEDVKNQILKPGDRSKLAKAVQQLICLIFDVNSMKKAMMEFEIDLKKMPLGKLSKRQIESAYSVLSELQELIKENGSESRFVDAANRFYTLVPHDFGMKKPPLIKSEEIIKSKIDMLDSLLEIEIAYNMLKEKPSADSDLDPIDQHYFQLKAEIDVLPTEAKEFSIISQYITNTHAETHSSYELQLLEAFSVARQGEDKRFKPFSKLPNHKLLWHGSRITNFAGILSKGLRIAPPEAPSTGYMFGKGIYFADMVSKSANYCFASRNNPFGLLLLCQVALGNMFECNDACYVQKLPTAKHSTKGVGKTYPDPSQSITLENGIEVPLGKPLKAGGRSALLYNEYIVYDVAQVKILYLLKVKFNYK